jgi:hypothetical protein
MTKLKEVKNIEEVKNYEVVKMHSRIAMGYYYFLSVLIAMVGIGSILKKIEWTMFFAIFAIGAYICFYTATVVKCGLKIKK